MRDVLRLMPLPALVLLMILTLLATGPAIAVERPDSPLRFTMKSIEGREVDLADYRGQVVLLVNTASKCGLTPQYQGLQALYDKYRERGFTILAFPANNFKEQEPGADSEIRQFCSVNYGVTFPLFSRISVQGAEIHPLYAWLTSEQTNPGFAGEIPWNFTKFLLDRQGRVVARFDPRTVPDDPQVVAAIERELGR